MQSDSAHIDINKAACVCHAVVLVVTTGSRCITCILISRAAKSAFTFSRDAALLWLRPSALLRSAAALSICFCSLLVLACISSCFSLDSAAAAFSLAAASRALYTTHLSRSLLPNHLVCCLNSAVAVSNCARSLVALACICFLFPLGPLSFLSCCCVSSPASRIGCWGH